MGIRTVMISGDSPRKVCAMTGEAGVDDFLAEATPERKPELIRRGQAEGRLVAMRGDGSNDAPALAQADVGVAMNSGTPAAGEAGNLVDLDSGPTTLIGIALVGRQLLISRGTLTTFSVANDMAKCLAIPARGDEIEAIDLSSGELIGRLRGAGPVSSPPPAARWRISSPRAT